MWFTEDGRRMPTVSPKGIYGFFGEYRFLSNFHQEPDSLHYNGYCYDSVEAAYQAAKSEEPSDWKRFTYLTPQGAKSAGQLLTVRPNWDQVKHGVMMCLLMQKFRDDPVMWNRLQKTGKKVLVETNNWGDTHWGQTQQGVGRNELGNMLMMIRSLPDPQQADYDENDFQPD